MHHEDPQDAGCQSPHLLQDHEDPQDAGCGLQVSGLRMPTTPSAPRAGCELSARAMSSLSHQDQGELHDLVLDLRSRRPDRGGQSQDLRVQIRGPKHPIPCKRRLTRRPKRSKWAIWGPDHRDRSQSRGQSPHLGVQMGSRNPRFAFSPL